MEMKWTGNASFDKRIKTKRDNSYILHAVCKENLK